MFKRMKLGMKIAVGFSTLIVIAVALGGLAAWTMNSVRVAATTLASADMPEVAVATDVERNALATMYAARGYAFAEDKAFLDQALTNLEEVKKNLKQAREHADRFNLPVLKQNAERAEAQVREYEQLLTQTVTATQAMAQDKAASLVAADNYMKQCYEYLANQTRKLQEEVAAAFGGQGATAPAAGETIDAAKLSKRIEKITTANDIIDLGNWIRTGTWQAIASRDPKLFEETEKKFADVNKKLDELKAGTAQEANLKQLEECRAAGKAYLECMSSFLKNWNVREELNAKRSMAANAVLEAARTTSQSGMEDTTKASQQAAASLGTATTTMIAGLAVGVLSGILLAFFTTRSITKPINRMIMNLTEGATQVTEASGQVSTAAQSLAEGASEQASSLEETSSALEQMAAMTRTNAENARKALESAEQARTAADEGDKTMRQLNEAMVAINDSSGQVSKIIKVIEEIAFQTNLLALNAAVEAARAGEHGKGFAVVAEEVRNLAQRCATAAKDTTTLIEGSVQRAKQGADIATEVGKALSGIVTEASRVSELINGIARASDEQAQGVEQVNVAVSQMDKVTQQNAAGAEESASAAEELSAQAVAVNGVVGELAALVGIRHDSSVLAGGAAAKKPAKGAAQPTTKMADFRRTHGQSAQEHTLLGAAGDQPVVAEDAGVREF
jgi:methyl-accepting chemotaxis protein